MCITLHNNFFGGAIIGGWLLGKYSDPTNFELPRLFVLRQRIISKPRWDVFLLKIPRAFIYPTLNSSNGEQLAKSITQTFPKLFRKTITWRVGRKINDWSYQWRVKHNEPQLLAVLVETVNYRILNLSGCQKTSNTSKFQFR